MPVSPITTEGRNSIMAARFRPDSAKPRTVYAGPVRNGAERRTLGQPTRKTR